MVGVFGMWITKVTLSLGFTLKLHYLSCMETKLIEYAYPSSTTATKAGMGNTGCWFVSLYQGDTCNRIRVIEDSYTTDKQTAINYANSLPNEFNPMHKYFN